jgi:hypothetical protein
MDRITFKVNGISYEVYCKREDTAKFMDLIVPICDKSEVTNNTTDANSKTF